MSLGVETLEQSLGLEDLAFGMFEVLFKELNSELEVIQQERIARDQAIAAMRGLAYEEVELEPVQDKDFHIGHVPSLILDDTPLDNYPSVAVMAYRMTPESFDDTDQLGSYRDQLYAEAIVKSLDDEGEEICDRRIWRTVDAINRVLTRNDTLYGQAFGLGSPTVIVSEVFTRPVSDTDDRDAFWQAARIEYGVSKFSPFS